MNTFAYFLKYGIFKAALALKRPFSARQRRKRMDAFVARMSLSGGERIIDLGGTVEFWQELSLCLHTTVVNLPGEIKPSVADSHHEFVFIEGDACSMHHICDNTFDIVFSNSVIEHVGDERRQEMMAHEVRRLAPRHWVQTPSIWFPIEAHNHMPFWWFYPARVQHYFLRRWDNKLPDWTAMIKHTTVLTKSRIQYLFPESQIYTERFLGIPKSYIAFRT